MYQFLIILYRKKSFKVWDGEITGQFLVDHQLSVNFYKEG